MCVRVLHQMCSSGGCLRPCRRHQPWLALFGGVHFAFCLLVTLTLPFPLAFTKAKTPFYARIESPIRSCHNTSATTRTIAIHTKRPSAYSSLWNNRPRRHGAPAHREKSFHRHQHQQPPVASYAGPTPRSTPFFSLEQHTSFIMGIVLADVAPAKCHRKRTG